MLETGFGLGLNFLVTWAAWKADPARPRLLLTEPGVGYRMKDD